MNQKNLLMAAMALLCASETSFAQSHQPGELIWSFATGGPIVSSPAIGPDGTIYVGSDDRNLYAINANGTRRWAFPTGNLVESSPLVGPDGTIYVGSHDNKLYAVNPDGTKKWEYLTGSDVISSPVVTTNGTVYVASLDHLLHAIDAEGFQLWHFDAGASVRASPALALDGTIYLGAGSNFFAVSPDGKQKWVFSASKAFYSSAAIADDGTIYVGCLDKKLYALSSAGTKLWEAKASKEIYASPAVGAEGIVCVGSYDGRFYAVRTNGFQKWNAATGSAVHSSAAIAEDGTIYVGSNDRKIYSFNSNGTTNWTFTTGAAVRSSPAIGPDGIVYAASTDKKLYALQGSASLAGTSWPMFQHDARHASGSEATNRTPVLNPLPNRVATTDQLLQFTVSAVDPDGNRLAFSLDPGAPAGASIDSTNGIFRWTPTAAEGMGDHTIIVRVTDSGVPVLSDFRVVTVTVSATNNSSLVAPLPDFGVHVGGLISTRMAAKEANPTAAEGAVAAPATDFLEWQSGEGRGATASPITVRVILSDTKNSSMAIIAANAANPGKSNQEVQLSWPAIAGATYKVQYKTNLNEELWSDLSGAITPINDSATKLDDTLGSAPQRFYRIVPQ